MVSEFTEKSLLKVMLVLTIVGAGVLFFVVGTDASHNDPIRGEAEVSSQIAALQAQIAENDALLNARLDGLQESLQAQAEDHLTDPMDVNIRLCGQLRVAAAGKIQGKTFLKVKAEGAAGLKLAGSGLWASFKANTEVSSGADLGGEFKGGVVVCTEGWDLELGRPMTVAEQEMVAELEAGAPGLRDALVAFAKEVDVNASNLETALRSYPDAEISPDPIVMFRGRDQGFRLGELLDALPISEELKDRLTDPEPLVSSVRTTLIDQLCGDPEPGSFFEEVCNLGLDLSGDFDLESLYNEAFMDRLLQGISVRLANLRTEVRMFALDKARFVCNGVRRILKQIGDTKIPPVFGPKPFEGLEKLLNCVIV